MLPAIERNIPLRIKTTFNPAHDGPLIPQTTPMTDRVVKNVTSIDRLGLRFRVVDADSGEIGGSRSQEFHVLADSGEDAIAFV